MQVQSGVAIWANYVHCRAETGSVISLPFLAAARQLLERGATLIFGSAMGELVRPSETWR